MKDHKVLWTPAGSSEFYTPAYAVVPIVKYIPKNAVIWCPFDEVHSEYVKVLSRTHSVIHSHIKHQQDFFEYEPVHWDIIISNPPFQGKRHIFERALSFGKPFNLLMTLTWLQDTAPSQLFRDTQLQLLMFDKRIHFTSNTGEIKKKTTFSCGYYCWNFLPNNLIIEKLVSS